MTKISDVDLQGKEAEFHSLFASDAEGRKIGVCITKGWIDDAPMDGSEPRRYAFNARATRDGELFGFRNGTRFFQTAEERDKAAEDYIDQAFNRAMKKTLKVGA